MFENGLYISRGAISNYVPSLKKAFYQSLELCEKYQNKHKVHQYMKNTVHHVPFLDQIYLDVLADELVNKPISNFFEGKKYILNSLGGQNNTAFNYASKIHRDTRFFTDNPLMLNSIWCISPINRLTGGTEFLLGSQNLETEPSDEYFEENKFQIDAEPGDVVYFDSRIWHRAGKPVQNVKERIIFTPIYSRPFIKPGFDYSLGMQQALSNKLFSKIHYQLFSYYSDIPKTHDDWYGFLKRRWYLKDQD